MSIVYQHIQDQSAPVEQQKLHSFSDWVINFISIEIGFCGYVTLRLIFILLNSWNYISGNLKNCANPKESEQMTDQ